MMLKNIKESLVCSEVHSYQVSAGLNRVGDGANDSSIISMAELLNKIDNAPRSVWFTDRDMFEKAEIEKSMKSLDKYAMVLGGGADMDFPEDGYGYDDTSERRWHEECGDGKLTARMAEDERVLGQERYISCRDVYDGGAPWRAGV